MGITISSKEELKETLKQWYTVLNCPNCDESLLKREAYTSVGSMSFTGGLALTIAVGTLPAATGIATVVSGTLTYFGIWSAWDYLVDKIDPLSTDQLYLERVDDETVICEHCGEPLSEKQSSLSDFE